MGRLPVQNTHTPVCIARSKAHLDPTPSGLQLDRLNPTRFPVNTGYDTDSCRRRQVLREIGCVSALFWMSAGCAAPPALPSNNRWPGSQCNKGQPLLQLPGTQTLGSELGRRV